MKLLKQFSLYTTLLLFIMFLFLWGCKKEEPLEPNPVMELYQNEHYAGGDDFFGDTTGNGGGTDTTGGGGTTVNEHFTVDIDGVSKSYSNPSFNFGTQIVNAVQASDQIQITRFSGFSVDTFNYPTIGLFRGQTSYQSIDGRLIIDSLTADFIKGTFYCNVESSGDTISLTNGSFKVAK